MDPVEALYRRLLEPWNVRDAAGMAALFARDGSLVGFDGSAIDGRGEIQRHLAPIFKDHPTAAFVGKVREVRYLGAGAALLRAVAGMVPPGAADIKPELNAVQAMVATSVDDGTWQVELFQNTPAAFHGRPDAVEALSAELREVLRATPPPC